MRPMRPNHAALRSLVAGAAPRSSTSRLASSSHCLPAPTSRVASFSTTSLRHSSSIPPTDSTKADTPSRPSPGAFTPRVGPLFLVLTLLGVAVTGIGLYDFYGSFKTWPKEVRVELRAAIKAQRKGENKRAKAAYERALAATRSLSPASLEPNALLKLSGIAISYASFLESTGDYLEAYHVYAAALSEMRGLELPDEATEATAWRALKRGNEERMRAVSLAQKCGDLAQIPEVRDELLKEGLEGSVAAASLVGKDGAKAPLDPAEAHLTWSVEELLKLAVPESKRLEALNASSASGAAGGSSPYETSSRPPVELGELELPSWVSRTELGASLEALAGYYSEQGRAEYAIPLYIQALGILMPNPSSASLPANAPGAPTAAERCRAATMMNNLGRLFLLDSPYGRGSGGRSAAKDEEEERSKMDSALAWSKKGLDVVSYTNQKAGWTTASGAPPSSGAEGKGTIKGKGQEGERRAQIVRAECIAAEVALCSNIGWMCELNKDACKARTFYQRAYMLSDQNGMREARSRAAEALSRLERKGTPS